MLNDLLLYGVYFIIIVCLWHYGMPKEVKKTIKKIIWKVIMYKAKPRRKETKSDTKQDINKIIDNSVKKRQQEREKDRELKRLREENIRLKQNKDVVFKRKDTTIEDEIKRQKEITKDLW